MHASAKESTGEYESERVAYTVPNAAKQLDISARTCWQLVYSGELGSFKIGWSRRVAHSAIEEYVRRKQHEAARETAA